MKSIKVDLSKELQSAEIHTFADLHIGDKFCNESEIKERIKYVKETPNAYAILNGDIINNATKTSVSDCYAEMLTPTQQMSRFTELFFPIKEKILCVTSGNHENRTYNKEGIDITRLCTRELGLEDRYSKSGAVVFLRFGKQSTHYHNRSVCYVIYCTHGTGGGRKEGAKAIRLADMASIIDADIYIYTRTRTFP